VFRSDWKNNHGLRGRGVVVNGSGDSLTGFATFAADVTTGGTAE
jgi:hypothetical protein